MDTVVGNTWLLYLNECSDVGLQQSKQLCLLEFKYFISPALAKEGHVVYTKRVSISISVEDIFTVRNWKNTTQMISKETVRNNNVGDPHIYQLKREWCKMPQCKSTPHIFCQKCEAYLCLDKNKNSFLKFHKEKPVHLNVMLIKCSTHIRTRKQQTIFLGKPEGKETSFVCYFFFLCFFCFDEVLCVNKT